MLQIIGGKFKGRRLKSAGPATRPTQAIVRGAVFNILQQIIEGSKFLDCFAGSGAMGFEALSRGAAEVTFIESDKKALRSIQQNIALLNVMDSVKVISYRAELAIKKLAAPFDLIYLDPPYKFPPYPIVEELLEKNLLKSHGFLFVEEKADSTPPEISGLTLISSRRFGETALHQFQKN